MNAARRDARQPPNAHPPAERTFDPDPRALADVRRFVGDQLAARGIAPDDAVLLAHELAANAVVHAGTRFTVSIIPRRHRLRVAVDDLANRAPTARRHTGSGQGGRGLVLVERLSSAWGVERVPGGKRVWFEIDC